MICITYRFCSPWQLLPLKRAVHAEEKAMIDKRAWKSNGPRAENKKLKQNAKKNRDTLIRVVFVYITLCSSYYETVRVPYHRLRDTVAAAFRTIFQYNKPFLHGAQVQ